MLEKAGPALQLTLGDRTVASVPYTVRFRLLTEELRLVHERFGAGGVFGIVRDESSRAVTTTMGDPAITVDDLFGPAREQCQETVAAAVRKRLQSDGIDVTGFLLGAVDLGRTGDVIQATVRARHELDQEQAEATTRLARALNDADLQVRANPAGEAWRYRETDLLRDLRPAPRGVTGRRARSRRRTARHDRHRPTFPRRAREMREPSHWPTASSRSWRCCFSASPPWGRPGVATRPRSGANRATTWRASPPTSMSRGHGSSAPRSNGSATTA